MMFDFHMRLSPRPDAAEQLVAAMDRAGIDRAAVCSGGVIDLDRLAEQVMVGGYVTDDADNDAVSDACRAHADRLVPFFFGNPHRSPDEYRDRAGEFRGLEISPAVHGVPLTDERNLGLVEVAAAAGHPVYVVCVGHPGCGAAELVELADKFPHATFVLGHCGFVGVDLYSINLIVPKANVLAETSGCYTAIARLAVARLGADRVLFGTEYPLQHPHVELAKLRALGVDTAEEELITWRNACRVLGEVDRNQQEET